MSPAPQLRIPLSEPEGDEAVLRCLLAAALRQDDLRAVFLARADGTICWANPAALRMFGYSLDTVMGQPLEMLFTPDDVKRGIPDLELEAAQCSNHGEDDRWMMRADGSSFWATGAAIPIRNEAGALQGYMKLLRNRTDLREQVLALRNERDALAARQDDVAKTIEKFAHELRNPLAVLSNVTVMLQRLAAKDDPRVAETLHLMQRQNAQMARLTDELLRTVQVENAPRSIRRTRVVLRKAIIDAVTAAVDDPADRERITLVLVPAEVVLLIDPMHLQQMLVNIIGNAVKYTPAPGPVWVRLSVEGDEAVVRVEDRGIGIAPDRLAHIFELFTRVTHDSDVPGSGIGLAVVRELAALHGGAVLAQSEGLGKGSQFTLRLPLGNGDALRDEAQLVANANAGGSTASAPDG